MIQISVKFDLEATVSQWPRTMGDHMPYATALTRTAKAAKTEVERQLLSLIDRPRPTPCAASASTQPPSASCWPRWTSASPSAPARTRVTT